MYVLLACFANFKNSTEILCCFSENTAYTYNNSDAFTLLSKKEDGRVIVYFKKWFLVENTSSTRGVVMSEIFVIQISFHLHISVFFTGPEKNLRDCRFIFRRHCSAYQRQKIVEQGDSRNTLRVIIKRLHFLTATTWHRLTSFCWS